MNRLQNIIAYFCANYPYKGELSKARLTKLVYLADWFSALADGKQLTNIEWVFNHYGPYVEDVVRAADEDYGFVIEDDWTSYGSRKQLIKFYGKPNDIELTNREEEILDAVIEKTRRLYFNDFIDYVYSTYPVSSKERYSVLDLERLAKEYKKQRQAAF